MRVLTLGIATFIAAAASRLVDATSAPTLHADSPIVPRSGAVARRDSIYADLTQEVITFFQVWNVAWRQSMTKDWPTPGGKKFDPPVRQGLMRESYQHCHAHQSPSSREGVIALDGEYSAILSTRSAFSICPSWSWGGAQKFVDGITASESDSADAAINPVLRQRVRAARAVLLTNF